MVRYFRKSKPTGAFKSEDSSNYAEGVFWVVEI